MIKLLITPRPTTVQFSVYGRTTSQLHHAAAQTLVNLADEGEKVDYHLHITAVDTETDGRVTHWQGEVAAVLIGKDDQESFFDQDNLL